jgi:predicted S18 family serine protease
MKKILLICASALFLTACADKEAYEKAVLEEMKINSDLVDYKIKPEKMTDCVVKMSSEEMPGAFPLDPVRLTSYQNYTKMLSMRTVEDKKAMLEELRAIFGSPQELVAARSNYTTSVMDCMATILMRSESAEKEKESIEEVEGEKKVVEKAEQTKDKIEKEGDNKAQGN